MLKKRPKMALLVALAFQIYGCASLVDGGPGGVGKVLWSKGKLQSDIKASPSQVHRATIEALRELELPILKDERDKLTAVVGSRFADKKGINIIIKPLPTSHTNVSIRVGIVGEKDRSQKILEMILTRLGL